jgi:hypothetical protein
MRSASKFVIACASIATIFIAVRLMPQGPESVVESNLTSTSAPVQNKSHQSENLGSGAGKLVNQAGTGDPAILQKAGLNSSHSLMTTSTSSKDGSELRVSGILGFSDHGRNVALLAVAGLSPMIVRQGDQVFDWQVVDIAPDEVQLRRNDETIRIPVDAPVDINHKDIALTVTSEMPVKANFYPGPRVAGVLGLD